MKLTIYLFLATVALTVGSVQAATITTAGTTGVFDESTNATNQIDVQYPGSTLAAFKTAVSTAYANNLGGVIDWETGVTASASGGTSSNNSLTSIDAAYGIGAGNTLTITFDNTMELYTNNVNGQISVLSQGIAANTSNAIITGGTSLTSLEYTMTFAGAGIVELGAAMPSRSTYGTSGVDFRATANFSGGGSTIFDFFVGGTVGTGDAFLHFAAPGGQTITSLKVAFLDDNAQGLATGQRRPTLDDVGFIVVPEPSAALLGGLGTLLLLRRRRN